MPLKSTKGKSKSLRQIAMDNTQVTQGSRRDSKVVKEGVPDEHFLHHNSTPNTIGASLGVTKNMGAYESLRVDVWLTDTIHDDETTEQAYERLINVLDGVVQETVTSYANYVR